MKTRLAFYSDFCGYKYKSISLSLFLEEYIKRLKQEAHRDSYKTETICVLLRYLSGNITGTYNKSSTKD